MDGERHVVIEKPDGSLVVGCNVDVPEPPPPPEEVVLAIPLEVVRYSPINAILADFLLLISEKQQKVQVRAQKREDTRLQALFDTWCGCYFHDFLVSPLDRAVPFE